MNASFEHMPILIPLIVGVVTILMSIVIHSIAGRSVLHLMLREMRRPVHARHYRHDIMLVWSATSVLLAGHLLEILMWSVLILALGEFPSLAPAFYHSAVNYTTLGYGDIVMSPQWRLLGPLEAADGMLMFGLTTAIIFAAINRIAAHNFESFEANPTD